MPSDTASASFIGAGASGGAVQSNLFSNVKISELIVLNDSSEISRKAIETYLARKWGLNYPHATSNGIFELESNGTLKTLVSLDREAAASYPIVVSATDTNGNFIDQNFSVSVLDDGLEDTDGDGFLDSIEISSGSNENNASSVPADLPGFLGEATLWLDATNVDLKQNTTLSNGGSISQWKDQSGNGKHLSVINNANSPVLNSALVNSKDVVSFTGDSLKTSEAIPVRSILAVHKTLNSHYLWDFRDGVANSWIYSGSAGSYWNQHVSNGVLQSSVNGGLVMNNQLQVAYFTGSSNGSGTFYLHSRYSNNEMGTGDVCELLIFNRLLNQQEIDSGEAYLAEKWGLDTTVDSDSDGFVDILEKNGINTYEQINGSYTWEDANSTAVTLGGYLATVTTQSEQDTVSSIISGSVWLGGSDAESEGNWSWSNGEAWSFVNWSNEKTFTFTGSDQTFTVPSGVTNLSVKIWGAGGGGGRDSHKGGAGGYTSGNLSVTPGESLTIIVGQGGIIHSGYPLSRDYRYGGGASGGGGSTYNNTFGSGGGRSAIRRGSNELATAGGGGGGGYGQDGGNAGGASGLPLLGSLGSAYPHGGSTNNNGAGPGGTGGTHGQAGNESGVAGIQFKGGYAQAINGTSNTESGGGGGGYFGGGGGGDNRGGGGGSGYHGGLLDGSTLGSSSGTFFPPNTSDPDYPDAASSGAGTSAVGTAGNGSSTGNTTGGHGFIILKWSNSQGPIDESLDFLAIDSASSGQWESFSGSEEKGFLLEKTFYTDPTKSDTDGDGFPDQVEIDLGNDPGSNTSKPILNHGLIAWNYPFDGNASLQTDMSGNNRHASAVNSHSYVSAKVGTGVRIVGSSSGVSGHVSLPYISSLENSDYTFAFWVLEEQMLGYSHGEDYLFYGQLERVANRQGGVAFPFSSSTDYISGINRSAWNHYAVTKSGSTNRGYLNGSLVATGSWSSPSAVSDTATHSALGRHWWDAGGSSSTRLVAVFDDLRIYDRSLIPSEISASTVLAIFKLSPTNLSALDLPNFFRKPGSRLNRRSILCIRSRWRCHYFSIGRWGGRHGEFTIQSGNKRYPENCSCFRL